MFVPLRGRAVAARRAHNPEVSGSNPLPATKENQSHKALIFFILHSKQRLTPINGIQTMEIINPMLTRKELLIPIEE